MLFSNSSAPVPKLLQIALVFSSVFFCFVCLNKFVNSLSFSDSLESLSNQSYSDTLGQLVLLPNSAICHWQSLWFFPLRMSTLRFNCIINFFVMTPFYVTFPVNVTIAHATVAHATTASFQCMQMLASFPGYVTEQKWWTRFCNDGNLPTQYAVSTASDRTVIFPNSYELCKY